MILHVAGAVHFFADRVLCIPVQHVLRGVAWWWPPCLHDEGSKAPQCKLARRAVPVVLVCLQHPTVLQSTSADGGEKKMATNGYSLKKSPGIVRAGGEDC